MTQNLILAGSGGCMRELLWQLEMVNQSHAPKGLWNIMGYVDVKPRISHGTTDISVGNITCPYMGDDEYLLAMKEETNVAVCVGEPELRRKIAEKLMGNPRLKFPNLILGDTRICSDVHMGQGCILSMDCRVSTNVTLGDFVFLNTGSMICHDGTVGNFTTLSPDAKLAAQVAVGCRCDLGLGTRVIQGITIGNDVTAGAGSVIVKDIPSGSKVAGVPARPM